MYRYKLNPIYEIIPLEIKIEVEPLNDKGFADILSISLETLYKLNRAKNRLNEINSFQWEEIKKITNPYEFIHAFNPKSKYNDSRSVAMLKPLSRSFFKMIEIIYEFVPHIIENNGANNGANKMGTKSIITTHIAEGPGGFIEAIRYVRKGNPNDLAYGMTLVKYDKNEYKNVHVPGWHKSNQFLCNNPEVKILNGADGTGDIYNIENIKFINNEIKHVISSRNGGDGGGCMRDSGADIVTADGGFDFSIEYNYQEQASCKLIFSQILAAINCQKKSGTFICKFFDFNLYFTAEMLYLLYTLYEHVTIYKPYTSRIANSEKYIVCTNFKGIDESLLNNLFDVLVKWNKYNSETNEKNEQNEKNETKKTINRIFVKIPNDFIEKIKLINTEIIDLQIKSINNSINIIKTKKYITDIKWYDETIKLQIQNATEWCKKYNIPYR